jgi:hypothetical protein
MNINDVKVGMVFLVQSRIVDVKNFARVTKVKGLIPNKAGKTKIFYAVYVDPKNFAKKRLPDDRVFAVWDFDFNNKYFKRVK